VFTRCPGCQTVHSLNAVLLAQGNGLYRCGNCNKVSNALQNLFDNMPAEGDVPPSADDESRQLPVLGGAHEQSPDQESEVSEEEAELLRAAGFREQADKSGGERKAWFAAAIVLVAVTFANLFFVSGNKLMAQPSIRAALQDIGAIETPPEPQYRNLDMLHLASSEMHSHPTLDETLVLNATIVNRADREQAFPKLQITLYDAQNQPLASRIFPPEQYLPNASGNDDSMPPGAYLPVIMELLDPGKHAVGFEMKFH
jgi:predicted Zn finger-like uncharacterized protein